MSITHITVPNPDDEHDLPIFDGPVTAAHRFLNPGRYAAQWISADSEDVYGTLVVREGGSVLTAESASHADDEPVETVFDMDAVVTQLAAMGIDSYVEQTGGGCATIYAGREFADSEGTPRRAASAGPGWFEKAGWTAPRAHVGDFSVGRDDDGESDPAFMPDGLPVKAAVLWAADQIARVVLADIATHAKAQIDSIVPATTIHYAVEDTRVSLARLARLAGGVPTINTTLTTKEA